MNSTTLCVVPWVHLNFQPNGKVTPCCLIKPYYAGDLNTQSIKEIWNSANMKNLRSEMMNNARPAVCSSCFDKEDATGKSNRHYRNGDYSDVLKNIPNITDSDGTCYTMQLKYWDFRFSNLCNFKCRSCGPAASSAWTKDAINLKWLEEQDKVLNTPVDFNFLESQIDNVEEIYFAGGEPLLMPEHWKILDMLIEHKKFDVRIRYNTNCSTLTYGKKDILDYWSKWNPNKISVWASIDEIGDRAELIRSGTVWRTVESNLKKLSNLDFIIFGVGITVGVLNVSRLPDIITHLTNLGIIKKNNFYINLIEAPAYYNVSVLPDDFKKTIIDDLISFANIHDSKYSTNIILEFKQTLVELTKPSNSKKLDLFIKTTKQLDKLRNENTWKTIPELIKLNDF
jgi:radical SAM protein with 4Fe4S-binding SPASM domain